MGLMLVVISSAFRLTYRSVESGDKKSEYIERTSSSMSVVESQFQSFLPIMYDDGALVKYRFSGTTDSASFSTDYSIWGSGPVMAYYNIDTDTDGKKTLYLTEESIYGFQSKEPMRVRLFSGMLDMSFSYFYKEPSAQKGRWVNSWIAGSSVPSLVRLSISDGNRELDIPIELRASR